MKKIKGFLKSTFRVVSGFLDAIKGIVKGDLTVKEACNFTKGSREYQKQQKEEENRKSIEKIRKDIHEIWKNVCNDEMSM